MIQSSALLRVKSLSLHFGGIVALNGVSLEVPQGAIVGLIGPNGAGKTSLFNCLSRLYQPDGGDIFFQAESILKLAPHQIGPLGIARTFQNLALFQQMTVLENVMTGFHGQGKGGVLGDALRLPSVRAQEHRIRTGAEALLEALDIAQLASQPAGGLPLGTLKRVELARALAGSPTLLLLDEPAGGLNHEEVRALGELIKDLRNRHNLTILLVEHHMGLVMAISDLVTVMNFGAVIAAGTPAQIQVHPEVVRAYLGGTEGGVPS